MITIELKLRENDREISLDHLADAFAAKIAAALRDHFAKSVSPARVEHELLPRKQSEAPLPRAVNVQEAARLLGIRPVTLRLHASRGMIQVVRIGRRVLVPMESIEKVLQEGLQRSPRR